MSKKNKNENKKSKKQAKKPVSKKQLEQQKIEKVNENVSPSVLEEVSQASSRLEAETIKETVKPKKSEQKLTPEEIEKQKNMTSWQRYVKSIKDGWQLEKDTMAEMETKREKISYFLYYHKWHIVIPLIMIFVMIYGIHAIVTHKDYAYNCLMINDSYNTEFRDAFQEEMESCLTYDTKKARLALSCYAMDPTNYEPGYYGGDGGTQSIFALMLDYRVDAITADYDIINWYAQDDNMCNLKETLPNDLYNKIEPYVVNCKDAKGNEFPGAVDLSKTKLFTENHSNLQTPTFAIFNTTKHMDKSITLLEHLFEE